MTIDIETRAFAGTLKLRNEGGEGPGTLVGQAVPFGSRSEDLGGFFEQFQRGAFEQSLAKDGRDDPKALIGHDQQGIALGSFRNGTLQLSEKKAGLAYELALPDTQAGRDLAVSAERGDIGGVSIGFTVRAGGAVWSEEEDGDQELLVRTVIAARLVEMSFVNFPAYSDVSVAKRSLLEWRGSDPAASLAEDAGRSRRLREAELSLRNAR